MKRVLAILALLLPGIFLAQTPKSTRVPFFEVDRSTLPPAVQNVPLERLSSGALMLLDRGGNLVRPPNVSPERRAAAIRAQAEVPLDPRVGPNVRLNDDPSSLPADMRAQAEPHIARSPVNPNFLVATFQEGRFTTGGAVDCGYSISQDGGQTWTRSLIQNLTQTSGGPYFRATDPVAGVDLNGNVYLNTEAATDANFNGGVILVSRSTNGGASFGSPSIVYQPPNTNVFPDKPWMAINTFPGTATAGRILVTFTLFANVNNAGGTIQRAYSDNQGATWSSVASANTNVTRAQGSQPVFLPNGNVVLVYWNSGTSGSPGERLEALISTNGGRTYGTPKLITSIVEFNEPSIRTGSILPSAAADRTAGNVFVAYQAMLNGNPRICFTKSTDGGNNWSVPVAISDNPAGLGVFNPALNVSPDGQIVSVVYYDHRDNPGSQNLVNLYLAQSTNGGTTWQPGIRLSSVTTDATLAPQTSAGYMLGDYQGVAEVTNANTPAVPVWVDTRTGSPDPFTTRVWPFSSPPTTPTPTPTATPTPTPSATPTPTPGTSVATPVFAPNSSTFRRKVNVQITCATAGATIRYTTDGSDPTATSTMYQATLKIKRTTTIKARAFAPGMADSAVASAVFQKVNGHSEAMLK